MNMNTLSLPIAIFTHCTKGAAGGEERSGHYVKILQTILVTKKICTYDDIVDSCTGIYLNSSISGKAYLHWRKM